METEMQRLENSAKEQYYKERVQELYERLHEAMDGQIENLQWKRRTGMLQMFNVITYFVALGLRVYLEMPYELFANSSMVLYWATFLFLIIREMTFENRARYHEGVFDGIFTALETLYPNIKDDTGNNQQVKKVKRTSLYKRFKEFFERVGQKQSKEVPA